MRAYDRNLTLAFVLVAGGALTSGVPVTAGAASVAGAASSSAAAGGVASGTVDGTHPGKYGFGVPVTKRQIKPWNINVFGNGRNLPPGAGTVMAGRKLYDAQCATCHGAKGEGGMGDRLAGGMGTLAAAKPVRTVGSYWPYAPTLFDYIRRAMPLNAPQSLSNDEVYSVAGYVLFLNGLAKEHDKIDAVYLKKVKMPNRDGFIEDPRPDVR